MLNVCGLLSAADSALAAPTFSIGHRMFYAINRATAAGSQIFGIPEERQLVLAAFIDPSWCLDVPVGCVPMTHAAIQSTQSHISFGQKSKTCAAASLLP